MEERIVDDEIGRGIRLKKTKDGYVDVTDVLAPETEEEEVELTEEIEVVLPPEEADEAEEEAAFAMKVVHREMDDEDLVDLSPEEAAHIRKEKEAELLRRQAAYQEACAEGETLLGQGSFHAAELVFERALEYDELATEASVGYWRAKTANFSDPDVLVEEYLEDGFEELESDLGVIATEIIKRDYRAAFETRLRELNEQEAPILERVESKRAERRVVLSKRRAMSFWLFLCSTLPFIGALVATMVVGLRNFSTPDDTFVVPTIVCGALALVTFLVTLFATNKFVNACRMYRMNETLSSTEDGKSVLDIREYKELYEALLKTPTEEDEDGDDE